MSLPAIGLQARTTERFARDATRHFRKFGIYPVDEEVPGLDEPSTGRLRRERRRRGEVGKVGYMSLVESDGVVRWQLGTGRAPSRLATPRRRADGILGFQTTGRVVRQFKFADLPPNEVGKKLTELDAMLTPGQGLRVVRPGASLGPEVFPSAEGRLLLLVHGTFSNASHLLEELTATPEGRQLLDRALNSGRYKQVLAFNHPTLSMSPILTAAALAQYFRDSAATVDVICHSRGGLVVRWWLEVLDHLASPRGRVVFAGPPLAGTGLAAPARLRAALNLLTNVSRALKSVATFSGRVCPAAAPIGEAAGILFGMFGKLTQVAARTPIVDAGVALIPGLAGQSREGANKEILRLRESFAALDTQRRTERYLRNYYFLTSNFEPQEPGWKFWQYFRGAQLADRAADVVFEGANDLVVDTASMTSLADGLPDGAIEAVHVEAFGGTSATVHHLNYFEQPQALKLIARALELP